MLRSAEMKTEATYIDRRQGTVTQWVDLRPIFEVFSRDTESSGGGRRKKPLWRKEAPDEVLSSTLVEAS